MNLRAASRILLYLSLTAFVACTSRVADFTIVSTKNVDIGSKYVKKGTYEGEDKTFVFLFPFGNPNLKTAVDKCIESGAGDLLTNAVINYTWSVYIGPLGYSVKGDVWAHATQSDLLYHKDQLFELLPGLHGVELVSCNDPADRRQVTSMH
jgi:hypothetical protein